MSYIWPIPEDQQYRTTQNFGESLLDYSKVCTTYNGKQYCLKAHNGIDLAVIRGTPILSCSDGLVTEAYNLALPGVGGYGNQVRVRETMGDGYREWIYGHALRISVQVGDSVSRGQIIMLADTTGMSTGDHLHLGVRDLDENKQVLNFDNGFFGYYDPLPLFSEPVEKLPVDMRYGQGYSYIREQAWRMLHEKYAKQKAEQAGFKFDDRFMKAHVYGYWPGNGPDSIYNVAYFSLWANMTYPAFQKIKGKPGGQNLTIFG